MIVRYGYLYFKLFNLLVVVIMLQTVDANVCQCTHLPFGLGWHNPVAGYAQWGQGHHECYLKDRGSCQ